MCSPPGSAARWAELGEVPEVPSQPEGVAEVGLGGSHPEGESGVRVGVSVLNSRVKASEMHFWTQNNPGFGYVSPAPGVCGESRLLCNGKEFPGVNL